MSDQNSQLYRTIIIPKGSIPPGVTTIVKISNMIPNTSPLIVASHRKNKYSNFGSMGENENVYFDKVDDNDVVAENHYSAQEPFLPDFVDEANYIECPSYIRKTNLTSADMEATNETVAGGFINASNKARNDHHIIRPYSNTASNSTVNVTPAKHPINNNNVRTVSSPQRCSNTSFSKRSAGLVNNAEGENAVNLRDDYIPCPSGSPQNISNVAVNKSLDSFVDKRNAIPNNLQAINTPNVNSNFQNGFNANGFPNTSTNGADTYYQNRPKNYTPRPPYSIQNKMNSTNREATNTVHDKEGVNTTVEYVPCPSDNRQAVNTHNNNFPNGFSLNDNVDLTRNNIPYSIRDIEPDLNTTSRIGPSITSINRAAVNPRARPKNYTPCPSNDVQKYMDSTNREAANTLPDNEFVNKLNTANNYIPCPADYRQAVNNHNNDFQNQVNIPYPVRGIRSDYATARNGPPNAAINGATDRDAINTVPEREFVDAVNTSSEFIPCPSRYLQNGVDKKQTENEFQGGLVDYRRTYAANGVQPDLDTNVSKHYIPCPLSVSQKSSNSDHEENTNADLTNSPDNIVQDSMNTVDNRRNENATYNTNNYTFFSKWQTTNIPKPAGPSNNFQRGMNYTYERPSTNGEAESTDNDPRNVVPCPSSGNRRNVPAAISRSITNTSNLTGSNIPCPSSSLQYGINTTYDGRSASTANGRPANKPNFSGSNVPCPSNGFQRGLKNTLSKEATNGSFSRGNTRTANQINSKSPCPLNSRRNVTFKT